MATVGIKGLQLQGSGHNSSTCDKWFDKCCHTMWSIISIYRLSVLYRLAL